MGQSYISDHGFSGRGRFRMTESDGPKFGDILGQPIAAPANPEPIPIGAAEPDLRKIARHFGVDPKRFVDEVRGSTALAQVARQILGLERQETRGVKPNDDRNWRMF